jgi:RNA methyltransferase, TrmH family
VSVYGKNACLALFETRPDDVRRAFVTERAVPLASEMLRELAKRRIPYRVVSAEEIAKVAKSEHHEGFCLVVKPRADPDEGSLFAKKRGAARAIYLDGVDNPHNVGAILRTAAHFGAIAVAGARSRMPRASGALARVAEGAAERVPVLRWDDPIASLRALSGSFELVATAHDAKENLFDAKLAERTIFLFGAEATGLSKEARALAQRTIAIPGTGAVESLNVSAACAVMLAEHYRRFA